MMHSHRTKESNYSYIFLAPEGTINSWELRFDPSGPNVVRGESNYFEHYLELVRLARKYPVRYVFCTTALQKLEHMPRSLHPYVIPGALPFASLDIFGVAAIRHTTLEDRVAHYAHSRYLSHWLLIDSTYARRDVNTHNYTSIACEPEEGLANSALISKISHWLEAQ